MPKLTLLAVVAEADLGLVGLTNALVLEGTTLLLCPVRLSSVACFDHLQATAKGTVAARNGHKRRGRVGKALSHKSYLGFHGVIRVRIRGTKTLGVVDLQGPVAKNSARGQNERESIGRKRGYCRLFE